MNTELIKFAKKAAKAWKGTDAYSQASNIISMLCDEIEKSEQPVAGSPTVKDVLLKTWAQDTEKMAKTLVIQSWSGGWYSVKVTENSEIECEIHDTQAEAIAVTIAYLNSAAEVEK